MSVSFEICGIWLLLFLILWCAWCFWITVCTYMNYYWTRWFNVFHISVCIDLYVGLVYLCAWLVCMFCSTVCSVCVWFTYVFNFYMYTIYLCVWFMYLWFNWLVYQCVWFICVTEFWVCLNCLCLCTSQFFVYFYLQLDFHLMKSNSTCSSLHTYLWVRMDVNTLVMSSSMKL